jgi:hypothetical protein
VIFVVFFDIVDVVVFVFAVKFVGTLWFVDYMDDLTQVLFNFTVLFVMNLCCNFK